MEDACLWPGDNREWTDALASGKRGVARWRTSRWRTDQQNPRLPAAYQRARFAKRRFLYSAILSQCSNKSTDHVYPRLVDTLGNPPPILAIRQQIIPLARGEVLEIGAGSGANFIHYDPTRVSRLYALEPNPGMIRLAERRRRRTKRSYL